MPRLLASTLHLIVLLTAAASAQAAAPFDNFDLSVPQAPAPIQVEGRQRLIYELHLSHFGDRELTPSALRVVDAANGATVASFNDKELAARSRVIGRKSGDTGAIKPGEREVIYLELEPARLPQELRHVLEFKAENADAPISVEGAAIALLAPPPLKLGPPLRGGPWIAIYSPQWPRGHRRVFYTLDGRARLPGRYAIDWVKLDAQGRTESGDADLPKSAFGYGEPVLAVADAVVAATRDSMAESPSVANNPRHDFDQAAGNYVVLALGDGRYATYEHLRPGSVKVREGDKVRVGQTIGELGFTGDSTGPHLHFHVADGRKPLASEGVGYGLSDFRLLGHYGDLDKLGKQPWDALDAATVPERRGEFPASNSVVEFPR